MPYTCAQVVAYLEEQKQKLQRLQSEYGQSQTDAEHLNVINEMISTIEAAEDEYGTIEPEMLPRMWDSALYACLTRAYQNCKTPRFNLT